MKKLLFEVLIAGISLQSCTRVHPTEAGFKVSNSGDYRGVDSLPLLTGFQFFAPGFSHIITIPTTMNHWEWKDVKDGEQNAITAACMGGAGFRLDIGFNYHVDAGKASHIYLKWKEDNLDDITDRYIKNMVRGACQDISGTLTVDSILNNLPAFEHAVDRLIKQRLSPDGFVVDGFNITSQPRPSDPALANAINNKIKAKQDAETSIMQLQISVAEANKKMALARGDSAQTVIAAAGRAAAALYDAEAIKAKQQVMTPNYIEYIKWFNIDPKTPRVPQYVGAGVNFWNK